MESRDRRPGTDPVAVAGKLDPRGISPVGPTAWRWTSPTGFSAVPPPGPRRRSRRPRRRLRVAARAPCAMAAATSADTAPCVAISVAGTPSSRLLHLVRVGDDAAAKHIAAPATSVSRSATSPPVHDSAVARVRPRARQASSTSSSIDRSSRPNRNARRAAREGRLERVGPCLRTWLDDVVDVDLEIACTDRHLDAVAVTAGLGERLRNEPTR